MVTHCIWCGVSVGLSFDGLCTTCLKYPTSIPMNPDAPQQIFVDPIQKVCVSHDGSFHRMPRVPFIYTSEHGALRVVIGAPKRPT